MRKELHLLQAEIGDQIEYDEETGDPKDVVGPYSHNIIALILRQIDRDYGKDEANQAIEELGLGDLGWSKQS